MPTDPRDARIAEITGRAEKATAGPWLYDGHSYAIGGFQMMLRRDDVGVTHADADFIAHAREDVPFLLTAEAEARETIARLTAGAPVDLVRDAEITERALKAEAALAQADASRASLHAALREVVDKWRKNKQYLDDHAQHEPLAKEQAHVWGVAAEQLADELAALLPSPQEQT